MSSAAAAVGLRFDLIADPRQFQSAVADAQQGWRSATDDMRAQARQVGEALTGTVDGFKAELSKISDAAKQDIVPLAQTLGETAGNIGSKFGSISGDAIEQAISTSFERINEKAVGLVDALADFAGKYTGKGGKAIAQFVGDNFVKPYVQDTLKDGVGLASDAFDKLAGTVAPRINSVGLAFDKVTGSVNQMRAGVVSAFTEAGSVTERYERVVKAASTLPLISDESAADAADKVSTLGQMVDGWIKSAQNAFDKITGRQRNKPETAPDPGPSLDAEKMQAVLNIIEKQIKANERNVEVIGKSTGEVAKLRAEWAALDAGAGPDTMSDAQKAQMEERLTKLRESADKAEASRKAEQLAKTLQGLEDEARKQEANAQAQSEAAQKTIEERSRITAMLEIAAKLGKQLVDLTDEERAKAEGIADARSRAAGIMAAQRAADSQTREYEAISRNLDRQIEQERARVSERGKGAGTIAAERVLMEAELRMRQRGRELSTEELDVLQDQALVLEQIVNSRQRGNSSRDTMLGLQRQADNLRVEGDTIAMASGQAAAYKAEMSALQRLKEQNIPVSERLREAIKAEARSIGDLTAANERYRFEKSAVDGLRAQNEQLRLEMETIGMSAAQTAAYRAEQQLLAQARRENITLSDETLARIRAESAAIGQNTAALAQKREALQLVGQTGQIVTQGLTSAFDDFLAGREVNWRNTINQMLAALAKLALQKSLFEPLFGGSGGGGGWLGTLLGGLTGLGGRSGSVESVGGWQTSWSAAPGMQGGGEVQQDKPIQVGEAGPEWFIPHAAGRIMSTDEMRRQRSPFSAPGAFTGGGPFGSVPSVPAPAAPSINMSFSPVIDARGADIGVEARIAAALAAAKPLFVNEAVQRVREVNVAVPGYLR